MALTLTGTQILAFVGKSAPTTADTEWADMVAAAILSGLTTRLNGAVILDASPAESELNVAMLLAGAEGFKRKEATFGLTGYADMEGNAIRVARDYLSGMQPLIDRYGAGPGIA
jgi:hypothetical protein